MTQEPNFEQTIVEGLRAVKRQVALQNQLLETIADASVRTALSVQQLAMANTEAPNYQRILAEFTSFDWSSIGATIERSDQFGAAIVSWRGQQFVRRSPSNKFGEALWFSRCVGKGDDGENLYERLVTFKAVSSIEVEPLPDKVVRHFSSTDAKQ